MEIAIRSNMASCIPILIYLDQFPFDSYLEEVSRKKKKEFRFTVHIDRIPKEKRDEIQHTIHGIDYMFYMFNGGTNVMCAEKAKKLFLGDRFKLVSRTKDHITTWVVIEK